jgi:uncharacterized protein
VELALPELGEGWTYYPPTEREIRTCAAPVSPRKAACSPQEFVLGLCK